MWYQKDCFDLDYGKPIIAFDNNNKYLLMPQIVGKGDYTLIGYNWFNLDNGEYNSAITYKTIQEAVKDYKDLSYSIYNVNIHIDLIT